MWTCEKCGRTFKRKNQSHYCGLAPTSIELYIANQAEEHQAHLLALDQLIMETVPSIHRCIVWSMPTYRLGNCDLSFSACQHHVSLYVGAEMIAQYNQQLQGIPWKKSAIYLRYDKPLPSALIKEIIQTMLEKDKKHVENS